MDTNLIAESYDGETAERRYGGAAPPPFPDDEAQFSLDIENQCVWARPDAGPARCISLTTGALRLLQRLLEGDASRPTKERSLPGASHRDVRPAFTAMQGFKAPPVLKHLQDARAPHAARPVWRAPVPAPVLSEPLSEREISILRYLPTNFSAVEIAGRIHVSVHTVKTHLRHIYAKLGVHRRTEAIRKAREFGLMPEMHPVRHRCECGRTM